MKRTLTTLLVSLSLFTACGDAELVDDEANLPGDVDRAPALSEGGKGDEWDWANDPARLANRLNYRLADLPRNGKLERPVWSDRYPTAVGIAPVAWSDTYWPSAELSSLIEQYAVEPGDRVDAEALERADVELGQMLVEQGYHEAAVDHRIEWSAAGVRAIVAVWAGPKFRMRFEGNHAFDSDELRNELEDAAENESERNPSALVGRLRAFYVQRGFLDAAVDAMRALIGTVSMRYPEISSCTSSCPRVAIRCAAGVTGSRVTLPPTTVPFESRICQHGPISPGYPSSLCSSAVRAFWVASHCCGSAAMVRASDLSSADTLPCWISRTLR